MILPARGWINRNLWIIDKLGRLVRLRPNVGQLMLDKAIELQRGSGNPVRIILVKPRQVGWSTWTEARGFCYINRTSQRTALVVSADLDSTNFVFNMTKLFQAEMPKDIRLKAGASSRKEIVFSAPHRSKFITQTAGKDVLGRGGTIHFFHGSEVAFWPHAKEGLAAVLQMVPQTTESAVILESTANGVGGAFHDLFWQAVDRFKATGDYAGYVPVFFPWYKFMEYQTEVPKGFAKDEQELGLQREYGLTDSQVFWRRLKVQELGGDESLFKQEYPSTALEAFQTAGNPVFMGKTINAQRSSATKDARYCILESDSRSGIKNVNRRFNCWQIARLPVSGHEYTMGIDTMEARLSDPQDVKSNLDRHGVLIFDRDTGEFVAIYHGQGPQSDLAKQCLYAATLYNEAWVAPEVPVGMEVLKYFRDKGYPNLYNRQIHDEQLSVEDGDNLGWRTTLITRRWLVESFKTALRDGSIRVMFSDIVDEMETFAYDKSGKPVHRAGKHDDLLFGAMIALQLHLRVPYKPSPYASDRTGEDVERESVKDLAMSGVIDPGTDDWEQDWEWN